MNEVVPVVGHPCWAGLWLWGIFGRYMPGAAISAGMLLVGTVIVPAAAVKYLGGGLKMRNRRQRAIPLLLAALSYTLTFLALLYLWPEPTRFTRLLHCVLCVQALCLFISAPLSPYFKISLHAMGVALLWFMPLLVRYHGLGTSAVYVHLLWLLPAGGLILWQRHAGGHHRLIELAAGLALPIALYLGLSALIDNACDMGAHAVAYLCSPIAR